MKFISILYFILLSTSCFSQPKSYTFEDVTALQKNEPRQIVVFIHTDWCSYCHLMKNKTFQSKNNINLLNSDFYFIDFNAELDQNIFWKNKNYPFVPKGIQTGTNALALELGTIDGKLTYPVLVVLNRDYEIIYQYSGYIKPTAFENLLKLIKD